MLRKALFKAGGAALGGALGTFIPIPVLGTLIGETIGVYVGDVLHELLMGGGMAAAGQKLKDDFGKLLSGGEKVFGWIKDGFGRLMEGLPKGPIGLGKWFLFGNIVDKVKLIGKAFFSRDAMNPPKSNEDKKNKKKDIKPKKSKRNRGGISKNQPKKSDDVSKSVSKKASYEESSPEIEFVPIVIKGGTTGGVNQSSSSKLVTAGGGGSSHDPYEVLDSQG